MSQVLKVLRAASVTETMRMTPEQAAFYLSETRYNVAACGRRSGKTAIAKRRGVRKALRWTGVPGARFIFGAPTHLQAESIFWNDIKALTPRWAMAEEPRESDKKIPLLNGAVIQVMGFDKPQRAEGSPVAHVALDEFANMSHKVWGDHVRPMLTDTQGTADIFGVPEGRNHYWELWCRAQQNETGEWSAHHWKSASVLPLYLGDTGAAREIESARASMDELTFRQEYEADFNNIEGRAYYNFTRETHARESLPYNPNRPLSLCFDFNLNPGTCVYVQEHTYRGRDPEVAEEFTAVIGEVHIPRNSNTPTVVRKVITDWLKGPDGGRPNIAKHAGEIYLYGDPAGGAKTTKSEAGSDWDVIRDMLRPLVGDRLRYRVKREQPLQKLRVNTLNSRLRTADGVKHLLVCPRRAPKTVEDLEVVTFKPGTSGELDKDKDDGRYSHLSDGLTYYTEAAHPLRSVNASSSGPL